ncbi:XRE family transcriptional regulator [Microbacterium protaetiae]|uniref:XRE family transcriptional regulator n=1 Tax=Microbacterium protaetiae TaxID=2509458 RepID=A0A4P6EEB6_9MICO|nr:helix-turn-helix transcriptional regulator [Microbacterium protaetiae]QAY60642.1 XRE family transcriptional regulator [Microbacterium protaetiae]
MQHLTQEILARAAHMSATDLARRAGVNRSTLHRIATGQVEPSLGTLRELAIVCGLDLTISLEPLSDPDAAAAARYLLEAASAQVELTEGGRAWVDRIGRLDADPLTILSVAGRASTLLAREGAALFRGNSSAARLASAGDAAGGRWAISGRAAIELGRDEPLSGPSVLWVDDVDAATGILTATHDRVATTVNAQVIVAGANTSVLVDTYTVGPVRYVAPIQMLLDCVGVGGQLEAAAMDIAKEWSE